MQQQFQRAVKLKLKKVKLESRTYRHPNGKTDPRVHVQHQHEIDVEQDAQGGNQRNQRDLKKFWGL